MTSKNAENQRRHRERLRAQGLQQVVMWVPGCLAPELRELERQFKAGVRIEGLVIRDKQSGRVRTLQMRR